MVKVSVIIPVYNVEEYILECIDSIVKQTLKEIEIIVVNDGSTDKSLDKIYSIKDKRIIIINQVNRGLSSARNKGLENSNGEYIVFIDSDDFISNDLALEKLYTLAKDTNVNIVSGNAILYYEENKEYKNIKKNSIFNKLEVISNEQFIMKSKNCNIAPVCFYMYNKKFLCENELKFKEGLYHEDELFTYKALLKSDKIAIYPEPYYIYRQRLGSIMHSKNDEKKVKDIISICLELDKIYINLKNNELKKVLRKRGYEMVMENMDNFKMKSIDKNTKYFLIKNIYSFKSCIRSIIAIIKPSIYYKIKNIINNI